jgi:TNF receptor-associated factor 2/TNF receptor-associated factor 3
MEHQQILVDTLSSLQNQSITTLPLPSSIPSLSTSVPDNTEIKLLKTELIRLTQINEELRSEIKSQQSMLNKHERDVNRALVNSQLNKGDICGLEKKLPTLISYNHNDGTYLWSIENIQDLFRNAKNAPQPIFVTSPPFYTSNDGYKLSLKLYLNGDKSVRDTYLSLYITLRRNDYDSLLNWPFTYPITFCLFDQSVKRDHVVRTLTPDIDSKCFQRPEMDSNISAGIPEFCPLWKVFSKEFDYVRNDKMYIKACVDFNVFPPKIWSHWAKLQSSGLPSHIQYIKLKEEFDDEK